jgi:tetratricopeptide (TPR) repeat protein
MHRGYAYDHKGDYDRAIADYTQVIKLDPNDAVAYYNRGRTYSYEKGDYDRARADWTKALQLNPNDANTRNQLRLIEGR